MKKTWLLCVLLTVALLCCSCAATVSGNNNNNLSKVTGGTYENADKYTAASQLTYQADAVDKVYLCWRAGTVHMTQSDSAVMTISEKDETLKDAEKLHWYMDGRTLRIQYWESGYQGEVDGNGKDLTVELPAGIGLELDITSADIVMDRHSLSNAVLKTTAGSLTAAELAADQLTAESTSGNILIGNLQADRAVINSTAGDVEVTELNVRELISVGTSSGSIRLMRVNAPKLTAESTSGDKTIGLAACDEAVLVGSSGNTVLRIAEESGMTLHHTASSGKLKVNLAYDTLPDGDIRVGGGHCAVNSTTASGDLTIEELK